VRQRLLESQARDALFVHCLILLKAATIGMTKIHFEEFFVILNDIMHEKITPCKPFFHLG
jgi:hypothetical protein